jgi:hypothetical protein
MTSPINHSTGISNFYIYHPLGAQDPPSEAVIPTGMVLPHHNRTNKCVLSNVAHKITNDLLFQIY